ncbi:BTAD domain-containing putative transcriptional regulator [Streptomyces chartreusis]|uniref:BTAD domain-containing putative transcriptional regulator n=1 Tax=Streptomyces chartreusis TaxID=1969 RepID=UPI00123CBEC3|nr:BTAD domain-containing putative transcriptional regulator [Streptomyces chartreusis]QEV73598.1 SARP family transcriptional regulator [Streptomyces chartreusis]
MSPADVPPGLGVLGPVTAWDRDGNTIALKGPRHRSVLARLIVARGRVVPVAHLVDDLWDDPPADPVGALRTFVAALRRALEPDRSPRTPARLLVTEGPGYALRVPTDGVDAWWFERAVADAGKLPPEEATVRLDESLGRWRGPAYAEFAEQPWARADSRRLTELRLHAVELRAEALMSLGEADRAAADLRAHGAEHPWRENAWRLLALALYRTGRQADALEVLRGARTLLADQLGIDPGPGLRALEEDILQQAAHLGRGDRPAWAGRPGQAGRRARGGHLAGDGASGQADRLSQAEDSARSVAAAQADERARPAASTQADHSARTADPAQPDRHPPADRTARPGETPASANPAGRVWEQVAAAYDRTVAPDARARLESTTGLLRNLAVTGGSGLLAAREHRVAAVAAAEELGDPELTARVIGAYDVPAIWTRLDDPEQAAQVVAAAERTLTALSSTAHGHAATPAAHEADKARLLATIALESRGTRLARGPQAARRAEEIARRLDDPALLAFALNAGFMQTFDRTGLAPRRDGIGAELVALSARHGLSTFETLGHLVRLQARSALGDFTTADHHAVAADALAVRHERPLVGVFTRWYAALRLDTTGRAPATEVEAAYRDAAALLGGAGMPGLAHGLLPLALLCLRLRRTLPLDFDDHTDWGPYAPWAHPLLLLDRGRRSEAAEALHATPEPPRDLLQEALWCLTAQAAVALGDRRTMARAHAALTPAANELAGAGSGLLTLGPVVGYLELCSG